MSDDVDYLISPPVSDVQLNALFSAAWTGWQTRDFAPIHRRSLGYVCAMADGELVGYVNVAWDGGVHAFLLDTTVHPRWQRRGIGRTLVERAIDVARARGVEWLHVDFEAPLRPFYAACGFRPTDAGLIRL